jgi:hypothetical protein
MARGSFQRSDLLGDGALRVTELPASSGERTGSGDGGQGDKMANLDAEQRIRFRD